MAGEALGIFTTKHINSEEYCKFIQSIGGVIKDSNKCTGYIEKHNEIVLFNGYDCLDSDFYESEKNYIKNKYNINVKYTYDLEGNTSGDRECGYLMLYICKEFVKVWKDSVISNEYGGFFNYEDIVNETDYESWLYKSEE